MASTFIGLPLATAAAAGSSVYVGTLYNISAVDLTIAAFYEYRVRQLILSGYDVIIAGGELIITG